MALATFVTSTMGIHAQSHALEQISENIANVNTTGYKKVETRFETQLTRFNDTGTDSHLFSAGVQDRRMIDVAGVLNTTNSVYDLGISGQGFFIVNGDTETLYSRAGNFQPSAITPQGYSAKTITYQRPDQNGNVLQSSPASYLINDAGYYVMGWNYNTEKEAFSSDLEPVIISPMEYYPGQETTQMSFKGNINASETETQLLKFTIYDNAFKAHTMTMKWTAQNEPNTWLVAVDIDGAAINSEPVKVKFDKNGKLTEPLPTSELQVSWQNGNTGTIRLDMRHFTQYATSLSGEVLSQDGKGFGTLTGSAWDENGILNATYSNGIQIPVCKVALARVPVPNMMEAVSGNMFTYNENAGDLEIVDLQNSATQTTIQGGTIETSNVSLEEEFTNLIITQRAYSGNVQTFTATNEMTQEAINILS